MHQSDQDYAAKIAALERTFRCLKRNILGTAAAGKLALEETATAFLLKARVEAAAADFQRLQATWEQMWTVHTLAGTQPTDEWEQDYDSCRSEIIVAKSYLEEVQRRRDEESSRQAPPDIDRSSSMTMPAVNIKPYLPPIPVPHFSGDWTKWPHFRDTFQSIVHNEPSLSNMERLHYLLGALSGEAASLISKFSIEARTYPLMWQRLKENYDNPRVLASIFLQSILESDGKGARSELQRYDQFLTRVADNIEAFRSLALENPAEFLLGSLALKALDPQTRRNFELSRKNAQEFPTADDVIGFVRQRKAAITMSRDFCVTSAVADPDLPRKSTKAHSPRRRSPRYYTQPNAMTFHTTKCTKERSPQTARSPRQGTSAIKPRKGNQSPPTRPQSSQGEPKPAQICPFCQGNHSLPRCFLFSDSPRAQRCDFINSLKCCRNCLRLGHSNIDCPSKWNCRFCNKRHHSLLHEEPNSPAAQSSFFCTPLRTRKAREETRSGFSAESSPHRHALLGTAEVLVLGHEGGLHSLRAILDSGSQHTFITQRAVNKIGLPLVSYEGSFTGLGGYTVAKPVGTIKCEIQAEGGHRRYESQALVVNDITPPVPSSRIPWHKVRHLKQHPLADKQFHAPRTIDMLLGVDLYPLVVTGAPVHSGVDRLFLLPTVFGMVVMGELGDTQFSIHDSAVMLTESQSTIEANLKAFWELEEPLGAAHKDPEEQRCEDHFVSTTTRTAEGRYVVRLPLTASAEPLGRNREVVTKRFLNLEHRLRGDPGLADQYHGFMMEYQQLGHCSLATKESDYLIPHHGIWQKRPEGDKLRVVFDASCESSNKLSLNSILLAGPKLQADIGNVLMNFRLFSIPLCADLVKMYRQILLHPQDRHLQHILWRDSPGGALIEMELNTVTYGLRSSAFQAQRVIRQLVRDEGEKYPLAVQAIATSMYIDDIVSGANTIEEAKELQRQLVSLFAKGGFTLAKWASSVPELIPLHQNVEPLHLNPRDSDSVKILGLIWNPTSDTLSYTVSNLPTSCITKRTILSAIARIFDPIGLVAPIVILVKILLQTIWKHQLDWDQHLPPDIEREWNTLTKEWNRIPDISVPRMVSSSKTSYHLIGFCDASSKAYAAAIYLRAKYPNGAVKSALIKAKTKVAPIKHTSIARLELCGALLLIRVLASIALPQLEGCTPVCYTDSTVVLSWLRIPTYQLKVFEANRVTEILSRTSQSSWRYVKSEENPADIASRGCLPCALRTKEIWWHGPAWLMQPVENWPPPLLCDSTGSSSFSYVSCHSLSKQAAHEIMERFSDYHTLIRTIARILRLLSIVRPPRRRMVDAITAEEFQTAKIKCVKIAQDKLDVRRYSQLSPYVDEHGVVRVGGRLRSAPVAACSKHPILLPRDCHLSHLVISSIHRRQYHAGPSLTLALLRSEFWIPQALKQIRSVINRCVNCRLQRARPTYPIMAPLPLERFSQTRPFLNVGTDYAGPFSIKQGSLRKSPVTKAYLCLFICMATKAVHLEAVSSLTTEAFLAALDRFVSRRGLPKTIRSDCGTNFVGASKYIKDIYQFLSLNEDCVAAWLAPKGIEWKFNPPHAPHFGGLWEAGVKSVKTLLTNTIGSQPHTFEELATVFTRIEQMLNSRPLCALNEDPENCGFLTPAHFIIGESLASIPELVDDSTLESLKSRWEATQARIKHIWDRWRLEYLHTLQQRNKWRKPTSEVNVGQLVILTERRNIVGQWPVGRIIEVHPGKDGIVRTATIRTPSDRTYLRPVISLVPLFPPGEDNTRGTYINGHQSHCDD